MGTDCSLSLLPVNIKSPRPLPQKYFSKPSTTSQIVQVESYMPKFKMRQTRLSSKSLGVTRPQRTQLDTVRAQCKDFDKNIDGLLTLGRRASSKCGFTAQTSAELTALEDSAKERHARIEEAKSSYEELARAEKLVNELGVRDTAKSSADAVVEMTSKVERQWSALLPSLAEKHPEYLEKVLDGRLDPADKGIRDRDQALIAELARSHECDRRTMQKELQRLREREMELEKDLIDARRLQMQAEQDLGQYNELAESSRQTFQTQMEIMDAQTKLIHDQIGQEVRWRQEAEYRVAWIHDEWTVDVQTHEADKEMLQEQLGMISHRRAEAEARAAELATLLAGAHSTAKRKRCALRRKLVQKRERIEHLKVQQQQTLDESRRLETAKQSLTEQVTSLKSQNEALQSTKSGLVDDKSRLEDQGARLTLANLELVHDKSRLDDEVASLTLANSALVHDKSQLQDEITRLKSQNETLRATMSNLAHNGRRLEDRITKLLSVKEDLLTANSGLVDYSHRLQNKVATLRSAKATLDDAKSQLESENADIRLKEATSTRRVKELEACIEAEQAAHAAAAADYAAKEDKLSANLSAAELRAKYAELRLQRESASSALLQEQLAACTSSRDDATHRLQRRSMIYFRPTLSGR
jgi:hypothetical protein